MTITPAQVAAGQAVYTPGLLRIYDWLVLGLSNRCIWRCPTPRLLEHYQRHITANHLDVGVGTGYFLDRCRYPSAAPRIALLDLNQNSLDFAARRIARYQPETLRRNVLEPIDYAGEPFDSVGINYLLHCLPGTMAEKAVAFDHLARLMKPDATLFGSTLLQVGVTRNWVARWLMAVYNRNGAFSNTTDSLDDLERELRLRFRDVTVEVIGCVAAFAGRK